VDKTFYSRLNRSGYLRVSNRVRILQVLLQNFHCRSAKCGSQAWWLSYWTGTRTC